MKKLIAISSLIFTVILFHSFHGPEYVMFDYAKRCFTENKTTRNLHVLFFKY